jgi:transposase InsO family protein
MTSPRHLRQRSNSLPSLTTNDLVNPFLEENIQPPFHEEEARTTPEPKSETQVQEGPSNEPKPVMVQDYGASTFDTEEQRIKREEDALVDKMHRLQLEMEIIRQQRDAARESARYHSNEATRLHDYRESSYPTSHPYTNDHSRNKIKPSDLPKFFGKDNEDIDEWIEKVSAIFTYSRAKDIDLLRILPLLLQGNASVWFTTLGDEGRARLTSWDTWKAALRNGFYLPDHEMTKQMLCRNRILKRTETFGDYFQSRRALQRYVYPAGTSDKVLIRDIMEGIPQHLHPIIRANSIGVRNIEDFRRVLIDLEPGIRDSRVYMPHHPRSATTPKGAVNNIYTPPAKARELSRTHGDKSLRPLPKTPCRCGEMHWYADCPSKKKTATVNFAAKKEPTSFPNNLPLGKAPRWKSWEKKKEDSPKEVNAIQTRSNKVIAKPSPALTTKNTLPESEVPVLEDTPHDASEDAVTDICPTFAIARFDKDQGMLHKICIDTGSSISCIDYDYVKKHLPDHEINTTSNLRLLGVGTNMTTGSIEVSIYMVTNNADVKYHRRVTLYVVPRLNTKVIIGNDQLMPMKARIDLKANLMTFADNMKQVIISSTRVVDNRLLRATARTKEAFTVKPGHQARVPIILDGTPGAELYYIEASQPSADLYIARSVAKTDADFHYSMLCNLGKTTVKIPAGTLVGYPENVDDPTTKLVNYVSPTPNQGSIDYDFEPEVAKLDLNPELTPSQQEDLRNVIRRQHAAFAYGNRKLGRTDLAIMKIETGDAEPVSQPPYHASPAGRKIIDETLAELMEEDVIEESDSPWASPAILVRQKGKDRFCIDFRKVNEVTKADQYPIPRIDDILSQFAGKAYFTTFDANKGFHQIEIDPKDREKTAFRTHRGLHQYKRMPFGLKSGPGIFQRLMDKVLGRYKWQMALVYIDDIIIYSPDFNTHLKDIETVLSLVAKSGITLSPTKCHLGYQSLNALGHTISNLGIGTTEGTVRAVKEFPKPTTKKEVQRFLGLCVYYRRFVKDFSKLAKPLYHLTKDDTKFNWDEDCEAAFEVMKEKLTTTPTLAHPDYEKPFLLYTDASNLGLGAVLAQNDAEGKEHPIVYLSRTLSPAESNYTITELECLAIVWSVRKLHTYLDGVKFTLITDHSALQWLFDFRGSNRRLVRWSLELQPYRDWMTIKYREGRIHLNADPLSRAPLPECNSITTATIPDAYIQDIVEGYRSDAYFQRVAEGITADPPLKEFDRFALQENGLITYSDPSDDHPRLCVPDGADKHRLRLNIIHDFHDAKIAGHLGITRTTNSISDLFYWPGLTRDIKDYVRSCSVCQRNKTSNKSYGPHQPLSVPSGRWHTVTMDFAGPLTVSGEGKWDMIMLVVDKLSKRCHLVPAKSTDGAPDTAKRFFDSIVRLHGLPAVIVSDRDVKFTSAFWKTLFERFGTKLALSTAYHPQTDGQSERMVRTVKEMLRSVINHKQSDWVEHLTAIEFAYNNSVHPSTKMTPFELDLGYHPRGLYACLSDSAYEVQTTTDFIETLQARQTAAHESLEKTRQTQASSVNKGRPKPTTYQVGDLVMLSTKFVNPPFLKGSGSRKLKAKYVGPFKVLRRISPTCYELELPDTVKAHPVINLEYLKDYHETPERFGSREEPPPEPITSSLHDEPEYEIDNIKDHRYTKKGALQYLEGAREAVDEYWKKQKEAKRKVHRHT